ncbi:MAG TPA: methyltransferase domain-containing protein [Flavisolibacter sp.]|nr:methyltransferase domain-containing protein [Flavisolibacter sp.]
MQFKDHFSKQAGIYSKYRPGYPAELFSYLNSLAGQHELAWDCGTGNGQAAIGLAKYFNKVIGTDPSSEQIKYAFPKENVEYRVEKAEQTSLPDSSADLVTIANALHWFDFNQFYPEVKRVLKSGGIIAAWAYIPPSISPEIDTCIRDFHDVVLNDYWIAENRYAEAGYKTIPFPFGQMVAPAFQSKKEMSLFDFREYLCTWSAVQRFINTREYDPTEAVFSRLLPLWGDPLSVKEVSWDLVLKLGVNKGKVVPHKTF